MSTLLAGRWKTTDEVIGVERVEGLRKYAREQNWCV